MPTSGTPAASPVLLEELVRFLRSTAVSEGISDELRSEITVETGLTNVLVEAVQNGRHVVVTGSAGAGKTHLLDAAAKRLRDGGATVVDWDGAPLGGGDSQCTALFVKDMTAFSEEERAEVVRFLSRGTPPVVVVAVNEGLLVELAARHEDSPMARCISLLHDAQKGVTASEVDPDAPVVIDAAGYDPVEDGALERLVALPLVQAAVEDDRSCGCSGEDPRVCYRRQAWQQLLKAPTVRKRLTEVMRLAAHDGRPPLFREVWEFVADIALGGRCDTSPPTSPWFWRVFYGDSRLSRRLREVADPTLTVVPSLDCRLYYGDWDEVRDSLLPEAPLVTLEDHTQHFGGDKYRWLKAQHYFIARDSDSSTLLRGVGGYKLLESRNEKDVNAIISAINVYMTYGLLIPSPNLNLWLDLQVERRSEKSVAQFSLGELEAAELSIQPARCVANFGEDSAGSLARSQYFLVHRESRAALALTTKLLAMLCGERAHRLSVREHAEIEWNLRRFFAEISTTSSRKNKLDILHMDFGRMSASLRRYQLKLDPPSIHREQA